MSERERTYILLVLIVGAAAANHLYGWKYGETLVHDAWLILLALLDPKPTIQVARTFAGGIFRRKPADPPAEEPKA